MVKLNGTNQKVVRFFLSLLRVDAVNRWIVEFELKFQARKVLMICYFCVLEGGKGGAAAVAERAVDPSRLDLRIGKILAAKKVSVLRRLNFASGKIISRIDFLCKSQLKCAAKILSQHSLLHLRLNLSKLISY